MSFLRLDDQFFTGIILDLHAGNESFDIDIQRNTSASTAGTPITVTVPGYQDQYRDVLSPTTDRYHYRIRHARGTCTDPGPWSRWVSAQPDTHFGGPTPPQRPASGELTFNPNRTNVTLRDKAGLAGQIWTNLEDGKITTSDPDVNACSGVQISVGRSTNLGAGFTVRNGGESVPVPATSITGLACNTLHYVYYDHDSETVNATTSKATAHDWNHMLLGSITTTEDRTDSAGTVCAGCGGAGSTDQDTKEII